MTHSLSDGLTLAQTTGQKLRDGVGSMAHGIREEMDGIRHHAESAAREQKQSAQRTRMIELAASVAGAVAAFVVSRLVSSRLTRHGR